MRSPYGLDTDQSDAIQEKILDALKAEEIGKVIRKSLDEYCDVAVEKTTEYLKGEYALVLEELVRDRASRLVKELLKGNQDVAGFLHLVARETVYGPDKGKPFVYDPDGVRAAIFETFKDSIRDAELISLKEENARLRDSLKFEREHRSRY